MMPGLPPKYLGLLYGVTLTFALAVGASVALRRSPSAPLPRRVATAPDAKDGAGLAQAHAGLDLLERITAADPVTAGSSGAIAVVTEESASAPHASPTDFDDIDIVIFQSDAGFAAVLGGERVRVGQQLPDGSQILRIDGRGLLLRSPDGRRREIHATSAVFTAEPNNDKGSMQ